MSHPLFPRYDTDNLDDLAMANAVAGEHPDYTIDYSKLIFSEAMDSVSLVFPSHFA